MYQSETILLLKRTGGYPLSSQIKKIAVASVQPEIKQQQGCYIFENRKKHPILGVWYAPYKKISRGPQCPVRALVGEFLEMVEKIRF